MSSGPSRWAHVDALKALACQLIVLHHLAFYGPMADHVAPLAPALFGWLAQHARIAVQVFLVVGGFLAAARLAPGGRLYPGSGIGLLGERFARLVLPYAAMLLIAIAASALARQWMAHDSISDPPQLRQLIAHLLLLHDLLGIEALSAGVWYVAIDFQLYAMLLAAVLGCAALERRYGVRRALAPLAVAVLVAASLLGFNRDPAWDVAAPYFFGSYGLGVLAAWWSGRRPRVRGLLATALVVTAALWLEWRARIAVAAAVAALLALFQARPQWVPGSAGRVLTGLSRISYGVFLVHFPVCLVVNAAFTRWAPHEAGWQALGLLVAWATSLWVGAVFHRQVERRTMAWLDARRQRRAGGSALA